MKTREPFFSPSRYYVIGIIICPMIFYIPKFYEYYTFCPPDYKGVSLEERLKIERGERTCQSTASIRV